jgi:ribose 5-phosphate isomerase RpiB
MKVMRVGIATDHGGFGLKEELVAALRAAGHEVVDFGAHALRVDDDYPDFVIPLAQAVVAGNVIVGWRSAAAASARRSVPTRSRASAPR